MNIKAFYNKYPYPNTAINNKSDLKKLIFQNKLLKIIKNFKSNGSVLEIGCGTGELSLLLSLSNYNVAGIDLSTKALQIAKNNNKNLKTKVVFKEVNILKPKGNKKYDITIANGVLHHTGNPIKAFTNMCKFTKKNGFVFIVLYTKSGLFIRKVIGKIIPYKIIQYIFRNKTKAVLYDAFYNPQEQSHTIKEVKNWFKKNNIKFLKYENFGNVFLMVGSKN